MPYTDGWYLSNDNPLVNLNTSMANATPSNDELVNFWRKAMLTPSSNDVNAVNTGKTGKTGNIVNMRKRKISRQIPSTNGADFSNVQSKIIELGTAGEDVKELLDARKKIPAVSETNLPILHPTANADSYSYVGDVHRVNPPNWTYGNTVAKEAAEETAEQATKKSFGTAAKEFGGKVGAKAKDIGGKLTTGASNTLKNFFNPQAGGWISYGWTPTKTGGGFLPGGPTAKTDWSKVGLNIGGQNIGKWANIGNIAMQGLDAIGGLSEMSKQNADIDDLESQILASAAGNPLLSSYLTSDDLALLGKLQRGNYDGNAGVGDAFSNLSNILSGAGSGALTGALGGLPGVLIGGIGGAINAGIDNMNSAGSQSTARLEALYQNLLNAEQQYKAMKRPNFTGLGIQQRYQDMYM